MSDRFVLKNRNQEELKVEVPEAFLPPKALWLDMNPAHGSGSDMFVHPEPIESFLPELVEGPAPESVAALMEKIHEFLLRNGGTLSLNFDTKDGEWTVALVWGEEAPDSPMAGAASYAIGRALSTALSTLIQEANI